MTRKIDFFIRRIQFQRTIPGFLENLGCLTLGNSKISEGNIFVCEKMANVERAESKVCFSTLEKNTFYLFHGPETCFILCNGYETLYIVYLALIRNMRDAPFPGASDIMTNCKWPTS